MKNKIFLFIFLLLFVSNYTIASPSITANEKTYSYEKFYKKDFKKFFHKDNNSSAKIQPLTDEDQNIDYGIDELEEEKRKAVENANSLLKDTYFDERHKIKTDDELIKGIVEKANVDTLSDDKNNINGVEIELTLDDCIKKALNHNPQIRSAFNNSEVYKTQIGQAWANYFPTFTMTNGYTKNRFFSLNFGVPQKIYNYYNAADINASMLLYDFGKTSAIAKMSKFTYESTLATLDETINTIVYNVKEAYYMLLYAKEKQEVYSDSIQSYKIQLRQAKLFYITGTKPKIDVTIAEYNLGNAQLGYIKATNEVAMAMAQLDNAMGSTTHSHYKINDYLSVKDCDYQFEDLVQKAYDSRPQLLSYRKKVQASEYMIKAAQRNFFPNIEAVAGLQIGGGAKFSDEYGWKFGAQFVYGSTNFLLLKRQIDEAKAVHKRDLADLDTMEQNVYLQVKQAYINLKNAKESIPVTALSLKHAQEQYRLSCGRYKAGVGDIIELKDSEVTYRNSRLDYLSALLQYNLSMADLEKIIGYKLLEKDSIK